MIAQGSMNNGIHLFIPAYPRPEYKDLGGAKGGTNADPIPQIQPYILPAVLPSPHPPVNRLQQH